MALPFSPSTTYVAGSLPSIKAQDLNDLQTYQALAYNTLGLQSSAPSVGSNTPQQQYKDAAGNVRHIVSHNGMPMGRRSEFREEWISNLNLYSTNGAPAALPRWLLTTSTGGALTGALSGLSTASGSAQGIPASAAQLDPGTASSAWISVRTASPICPLSGLTGLTFELEWECYPWHITQTNWMGLVSTGMSSLPVPGSNPYIWFRAISGGNWLCETYDGTTVNSQGSGVAPSGGVQRFKIEVYGSASPLGAKTVKFFINEVVVATSTTNISTAVDYALGFAVQNTSAVGDSPMYVGPALATWNRFASLPAL